MIGQEAANVAREFNAQLEWLGLSLPRLMVILVVVRPSVRHITGKPIKFTGTGEKITDIETFHPDRMSSRILGMGDMLTDWEKPSSEYDEQKSPWNGWEDARKHLWFWFHWSIGSGANMGPMETCSKMIPGRLTIQPSKHEGRWTPDCSQTYCVFNDTWRTWKPRFVKSSRRRYRCWFWKYLCPKLINSSRL